MTATEPRRVRLLRLLDLVDRFQGRRVAVLGDLVVDEFVYGDIAKISREAPVLILDHTRTEVVPGGGANSVTNLRALDAAPLPIGVVGRDQAGKALIDEFRRTGVGTSRIAAVAGYRTPTKSRILAGGVHTRRQQIVRIDRGSERGEVARSTATRLRRSLRSALEIAEGALVADYGYGAASPALLGPELRKRASRGLPVTVDSRARVTEFSGLAACTPNQEEVEEALGQELRSDADVIAGGRRLLTRTGHDCVLITRGARGMSLFERRRKPLHVPAWGSDEVADVTGAGDTVIAVFTLALVCGATNEEAARLSNYAAGIVVTKAGTATVSRDELRQAIEEDHTQ